MRSSISSSSCSHALQSPRRVVLRFTRDLRRFIASRWRADATHAPMPRNRPRKGRIFTRMKRRRSMEVASKGQGRVYVFFVQYPRAGSPDRRGGISWRRRWKMRPWSPPLTPRKVTNTPVSRWNDALYREKRRCDSNLFHHFDVAQRCETRMREITICERLEQISSEFGYRWLKSACPWRNKGSKGANLLSVILK